MRGSDYGIGAKKRSGLSSGCSLIITRVFVTHAEVDCRCPERIGYYHR